ncbi:MAG: flagellar hook-length control protein FliK [Fimbriimonadales bacterium]|nr:flagellar hook-length control protein FliK [Fimbriimonadales bacterium]
MRAEPLSSNGVEGVSPVPSARQGETLSSLLQSAEGAQESPPHSVEGRRAPHEPFEPSPERVVPPSASHGAAAQHGAFHTTQAHAIEASPRAEPSWHAAEQVAQHIERMVYDRERDSIIVRLDPPELGAIELRIQTTGNEVQAWVNAERDLTRQLLQQAQQQLREQLESRGLQLTHFDVGGQSHSHFSQARPFRTSITHTTFPTHPSTATDSLNYDGRWSVWV